MIGAYGHDDRVDAYPALMAEIEVQHPAHTTVCILTDKEEVGSDGVTGMNSMYAYHFLQQLCAATGVDSIAAFQASKCLSADVTAAYDPSFSEAFEPDNGTYAGRGVAIYKYTGAGGKSSTSDANAELVSYLTRLMNKNGVVCRSAKWAAWTLAAAALSPNMWPTAILIPLISVCPFWPCTLRSRSFPRPMLHGLPYLPGFLYGC